MRGEGEDRDVLGNKCHKTLGESPTNEIQNIDNNVELQGIRIYAWDIIQMALYRKVRLVGEIHAH